MRQILLERAQDVGVTVKNLRAAKPVLRHSKICGVETCEGIIDSRFLIDASGASHWLARARKEPVKPLSPPLIAWYGWAKSERAAEFGLPTLTIDDVGWSWIAQVDADLCAWTRLNFQLAGLERLQMPRQLDGFAVIGRERGAEVTWRTVSTHAGDGFFRVGDAGAVLDPAASHGVVRALLTGIAAVDSCVRVLKRGRPEPTEAVCFNRWVDKMLIADASALRSLYDRRTAIRRVWTPQSELWSTLGSSRKR
jgi:flavin-dependent dehydrogenase